MLPRPFVAFPGVGLAARRSKPLAKRALHSAVASERLAVIWAKTFVGIRTSEIGRGSIMGVTWAANHLTG
jgi:hypothetical protein